MPAVAPREIAEPPGGGPPRSPRRLWSRSRRGAAGDRATALVHASLLFTAVLWGGNFVATKVLLGPLEPLDLAFLRAVGTALLAVLMLGMTGRPAIRLPAADGARLVALGVVGITVVNVAATNGQMLLPATLSSLIVSSYPVFTVVLGRFGGERLGPRQAAGMALALAGLVVVVLYGTGQAASLGGGRLEGVAILTIAPLSWACYTVFSKPLLVRHSPTHVTACMLLAGSFGLLLAPLLRPAMLGRIGRLDAANWGAVAFTTLLAGALASVLWTRGVRFLAPSQTAIYAYLVPVVGVLAAWLPLGEPVTPFLLVGGVLVVAVIATANSGRRSPVAAPPGPGANQIARGESGSFGGWRPPGRRLRWSPRGKRTAGG